MRDLWRRLAETGIADYMHGSANRPHLTLAMSTALDVAAAERALAAFARAWSPFPLVLAHIGAFVTPAAVAFLASTPTVDLLRIHQGTLDLFADIGAEPWELYLPGRWVPHCTVAFQMGEAALPKVIEASQSWPLPLVAEVTEVGVMEVSPTRPLFSIRLGAP